VLAYPAKIGAQRLDQVSRATFDTGAGPLRLRVHEDVIELGKLPWRGRAVECAACHRHDTLSEEARDQDSGKRQWRTGDVLVVAEWDRATRSMMDGVQIIERIHARGAMIKVLDKPHLDLTTPIGRGFIAFLSALAEDERQRIVKRANDGRAAARKRGVHMGRKPKLTELQRRVARERIAEGESARSIAQE
jgi:DNA invertase Pin-like site-specific DNA recombinase